MLKFGIGLLFVTLIHSTVITLWCNQVQIGEDINVFRFVLVIELLISLAVMIVGIVQEVKKNKKGYDHDSCKKSLQE